MELKLISLEDIDHQRKLKDREESEFYSNNFKRIRDSIKEIGLIQPIVVSKKEKGGYELVVGKRRLFAFKSLALTDNQYNKIPAIVIDDPGELQKYSMFFFENHARGQEKNDYYFYINILSLYASYLGYKENLIENGLAKYKKFMQTYIRKGSKVSTEEFEDTKKTFEFLEKYSISIWQFKTMGWIVQSPQKIKQLFIEKKLNAKRVGKLYSLIKKGIDVSELLEKIESGKISGSAIDKEIEYLKMETEKEFDKTKRRILKQTMVIEERLKQIRKMAAKTKSKKKIQEILEEFNKVLLQNINTKEEE